MAWLRYIWRMTRVGRPPQLFISYVRATSHLHAECLAEIHLEKDEGWVDHHNYLSRMSGQRHIFIREFASFVCFPSLENLIWDRELSVTCFLQSEVNWIPK
ncbi:hypothetical protein J6590_019885 [Homalodisca vitripennis]|nr:hypothetical protein J6590_019885 [Homalodisca vitripennis]